MSPFSPPFSPTEPWPFSEIIFPVSTPLGIFTFNFLLFRTAPLPPHFLQGWSIISPVPWHLSQEEVLTNLPKGVFCSDVTWPDPWHLSHSCFSEPGSILLPWQWPHSSLTFTEISFSTPKIASKKSRVTSTLVSGPFFGMSFLFAYSYLFDLEPPKISKMSSKISENPPKPLPPAPPILPLRPSSP